MLDWFQRGKWGFGGHAQSLVPLGVLLEVGQPCAVSGCSRRKRGTDLISNLGALGAMVFAMAGSARLGTCGVVEEDCEDEDEELVVFANCRRDLDLKDAVERVANAGVSARRGRADRKARIHGLCIQNVGGNQARGDSSLPRCCALAAGKTSAIAQKAGPPARLTRG